MKLYIYVLVILLVMFLLALCAGCSQIIYTDPNGVTVQVNTLFKDIKFDELKIKELVEMKRYTGDSKNIKVITPSGYAETSDSDSN